MSELVNNLQEIYNIKLQIKDALGTESDLFSDYPDLIEAMAQGGGSATPVDPWYESKNVVSMLDEGLSSADYVYADLSENFSVTMDGNDAIEAVEWDFYADIPTGELDQNNENITEQKKFHVIVNGDPHEIFGQAEAIDEALNDFSDLYDGVFPVLENATLTASEDPQTDGYDYLLEGDIYVWNLNDNSAAVQTITQNGFYVNDSAVGYDIDVPSSGITPTGKFNNFILKGHDGTVFCLYPTQNDSNAYADITGDAKLYNIILEDIDAGVDAYDYIEYYFTDRTGSRLSNQSYYPCWNYNNVSNAVIHTSTNFIAGNSGINLYAVQHTVVQDPDWSPNPDMPDEVAPMIDTPGTPYQLYLEGEPDIPCVIDGENYYVIYGNSGLFYYNGYLEGYLTNNNGV